MSVAVGDFFEVRLRWQDDTRHGSFLSGRLQRTVREVLHPHCWRKLAHEMRHAVDGRSRFDAESMAVLIREERAAAAYRKVVEDGSFWRPDSLAVRPAEIILRSDDGVHELTLPADVGTCRATGAALRGDRSEISGLKYLVQAMEKALHEAAFVRPILSNGHRAPLVVGHACVTWSDGEIRLWTDPFLRPKRRRYPDHQRPASPLDTLEQRHIVLITHAHPDHFDPGSLLLFSPDTCIVVPRVDAENPLTLDLALRVRQLGFTDVVPLGWGESRTFGTFEVTALPFFGEQPLGPHAEAERLDRNQGSIYHVADRRGLTAVFLADAGADPTGSSLNLAREIRRELGRVDILFGNHRRWRVTPPQHLTTSVPQNICYVPDSELAVPQATMLTPDELQVIGAALGARWIVPYAMGNAPWFAEIGLGPDSAAGPTHATAFDAPLDETAAFDQDSLIVPSARFIVVGPGQGIHTTGTWRDIGFDAINPGAFPRLPEALQLVPRALALGGIEASQVIRDLLELTRVDDRAYVIAARNFLEIVTDGGSSGELLWHLLYKLSPPRLWEFRSTKPLTTGLFGKTPGWQTLFEDCHRRAICSLRDSRAPVTELKNLVHGRLIEGVPPQLLRSVILELLGIDVTIASTTPVVQAPDLGEKIDLPSAAMFLTAEYGTNLVARALLIAKLIHNVAVTSAAIGRPLATTESMLFEQILT